MKTVNLKVRIQVDETHHEIQQNAEEVMERLIDHLETPVEDLDGVPVNHLTKHGIEIMIMDRDDK